MWFFFRYSGFHVTWCLFSFTVFNSNQWGCLQKFSKLLLLLLTWSSLFYYLVSVYQLRKTIVWLWLRELTVGLLRHLALVLGFQMDNKTLYNARIASSWRRHELGFLILYALLFYFFIIRHSLQLSRGTQFYLFLF